VSYFAVPDVEKENGLMYIVQYKFAVQ